MECCSLQFSALQAANARTGLWQTAYKPKSDNLRGTDLAPALPGVLSADRQGSPGCPGKPTGAVSRPAAPSPVPFPTCPAQPCAGSQPNKRPPSSSSALSLPWHSPHPSLTLACSSHSTSLKALTAPEGQPLHIMIHGPTACICHPNLSRAQ